MQLALQTFSTLMKLDFLSRPCGPITEAEKQFRKQRGLCNYCGTHPLSTTCAKLTQQDAIRVVQFFIKSHKILLPSTSTLPIKE